MPAAGSRTSCARRRQARDRDRRRRYRQRLCRHQQSPRPPRASRSSSWLAMPPEQENKPLVWPYWPVKLRTSSSHEEGCNREFAIATKEFVGEGGKVSGLKSVRVEWQGGRMAEVAGSEQTLPADLVLLAMGFVSPVSSVLEAFGVEKDPRGKRPGDHRGGRRLRDQRREGLRGRRHAAWAIAGGLGDSGRTAGSARGRPVPDGHDRAAALTEAPRGRGYREPAHFVEGEDPLRDHGPVASPPRQRARIPRPRGCLTGGPGADAPCMPSSDLHDDTDASAVRSRAGRSPPRRTGADRDRSRPFRLRPGQARTDRCLDALRPRRGGRDPRRIGLRQDDAAEADRRRPCGGCGQRARRRPGDRYAQRPPAVRIATSTWNAVPVRRAVHRSVGVRERRLSAA